MQENNFHAFNLPSRLRLYNTPTASLQRGNPTPVPTTVLDMILNNLMVRFQGLWRKRSTPPLLLLPGPLRPGMVAPARVLSMG